MKFYRIIYNTLIIILLLSIISCKKETDDGQNIQNNEFKWKSEVKISDIPDFPVKGFINGKEIKIEYINFEQWRGSGDNVINFGDVKPKNNCGYIESDNSFHLIHKAGEIKSGELLKAGFENNLDGYSAYIETSGEKKNEQKKSVPWNCALVITSIEDKTVKGKIIMCFNDEKRSWISGTFEAIRCNN